MNKFGKYQSDIKDIHIFFKGGTRIIAWTKIGNIFEE